MVVSCNDTADSSVFIDNPIIRFNNANDEGNFTMTPTSTSEVDTKMLLEFNLVGSNSANYHLNRSSY
jgi:hypothetical protein